jgi:Fic family protein
VHAAKRILELVESDRVRIEALGRPAANALRLFQYAQSNPILSIATVAERTGISIPTVTKAVAHLQKLEVLREITGKQRRRMYAYARYLAILNEGTEPLP